MRAGLAPLRDRDFRQLFLGRSASALGDSLMPVAIAFAVLEVGGTATDIGVVLAVTTVARVLLLLVAGVFGDRTSRRLLLVGSDGVQGATQLAVGLALLTGHGSVPLLAAAGVVFGAADAFSSPALVGLIPRLVEPGLLTSANALMSLTRSATFIAGPALSGLLVAAVGVGWVFLADALTFAVAIGCTLTVRALGVTERERTTFFADLVAGGRHVARQRWLWLNLSVHAVWNFAITPFFVLGPVIVSEQLGGPASWGVVTGVGAAGAVLGGVLLLRWVPARPLVVANVALAVTAIELLALSGPSVLLVVIGAVLVGDLALVLLIELWNTTVQQLVPDEVLSRVSSYDYLVSLLAMPLGYALCGPLADHVGDRAVLLGAAALIAVPPLAVLLTRSVRDVRRAPDGSIVAADPVPA